MIYNHSIFICKWKIYTGLQAKKKQPFRFVICQNFEKSQSIILYNYFNQVTYFILLSVHYIRSCITNILWSNVPF